MNKEIKYSGIAANLPGYNCPDGEFDVVIDLWPENGTYKPVLPPETTLSLSSGQKVVYLHTPKGANRNYIIYVAETSGGTTTYKLYWSTSSTIISGNLLMTFASGTSFVEANAIGNTLIVITDSGMNYFLWKPDNSNYVSLGSHIPELNISFGLQGTMVRSNEDVTVVFPETQSGNTFTEKNRDAVTSSVLAKVNKFIADEATNKGKFIFPFLVRWAYRLYDGSLTMQSAPVAMIANTYCGPEAICLNNEVTTSQLKYRVAGIVHDLDYRVLSSSSVINTLQTWGDIVKSVDIFISAPICLYDQAGECEGYGGYTDVRNRTVCKFKNPASSYPALGSYYQVHKVADLYAKSAVGTSDVIRIQLPVKGEDFLKDSLANASLFYMFKSINIADLNTSVNRAVISVGADYLQSLVNREVLPDDYDSHDTLIPSRSFSYNQRLNLANLSKVLYSGPALESQVQHTDGYAEYSSGTLIEYPNPYSVKVYTTIKQDGKTFVVDAAAGFMGYNAWNTVMYLYYPNVNATMVQLYFNNDGQIIELNMNSHSMLNGAVAVANYRAYVAHAAPSASANRTVSLPNKIYTSEVNNPFFFPVTNINTVGVGEIIGISAAAKPMSLGQFGQFPLYAFSTDGIWALSVNETGGYSAKQPISMEVAKPGTISQLDSAVAFSTDRGLMVVSGSQVNCISDTIDGKSDSVFNVVSSLPGCSTVFSGESVLSQMVAFRTFLINAKTIYDPVSQRLIVFNPSKPYAYVFAMDGSKQWGMMRSAIVSAVNSYPHAMAMTSANTLVDFSVRGSHTTPLANYQMMCTRPLKLDAPDVLKRINSVIQRGNFSKHSSDVNHPDPVQCILYGSRNLANWFPVWSSSNEYMRSIHGTPYKYFRIVLKCWLYDSESISGCSVEFTPELVDQPR